MHIYIQYAAMYLIGQALHLLLIKIPELKKLSGANNYTFTFSGWWKSDWNIIIGSALLGPSLLIGFDQITNFKPILKEFDLWMFWLVGVLGSAISMRFSKYAEVAMSFLSVKANISDAITGKTESKADLIEKGIVATGQDITQSPVQYNAKKES